MLKFIVPLQLRLMELRDREEGQAFAEYAVLVAVVAILLIATMALFRGSIATAFGKIGTALSTL
jgi:Flp pilus assembly pilin Flp